MGTEGKLRASWIANTKKLSFKDDSGRFDLLPLKVQHGTFCSDDSMPHETHWDIRASCGTSRQAAWLNRDDTEIQRPLPLLTQGNTSVRAHQSGPCQETQVIIIETVHAFLTES